MAEIPNLAGVATADLVDKIESDNFQASYINWSRTMQLLRANAPGWLPELAKTDDGGILWPAPVGVFLMIYFRHTDGTCTPAVPQAIMDSRNAAVITTKITARDITDTHRRGICMAAALTFGLAYELWAKVALESGYPDAQPQTAEELRLAACQEAVGKHGESVQAIKDGIDSGDYVKAAEAWYELDQDTMRALWIAPSKGGPFTTKQREIMRSDEFTKHRTEEQQ